MAVVVYAFVSLIGAMLGAALMAPYSLLAALLVGPFLGSSIAIAVTAVFLVFRSRSEEHQWVPNGVVWG